MHPRRKKRLTVVTSILVGFAVVLGFVLYALSNTVDLFFTPSEIVQGKKETGEKPVIGQRIRVGGLVVPGTVSRDPKSLKVSFQLVDTGPIITVKYDGILPDLFREGQGIVANGILVGDTVLEANEVLAKHDENYMPKEIADAVGQYHDKPSYSKEQLENKN
ncbi:cytochrome c maturation protein CcmE [Thalassotalea agarivorans]|uniref:Cytochrome c-type biogenesis protein CcmE n=1 Tax=Thalassotalea agarivorans TaxID=349064 RepID=A0A1H9Y0Q2_THASX|nr:cytochrome c maturation protein CcmE [Thalassotalea agarivorans]SES62307.1 cytochrome c-type biogenesis protein CcmE [Thalassotalea agarivorans]